MSFLLVTYCSLIAICSALGGSLPTYVKLTHRRIQFTLSLVSGVMLGVALLHLLPHSVYVLENVNMAMAICLAGLLFMFFLIRTFHFHQHDLAVEVEDQLGHPENCDHGHDHDRDEVQDADKHHVHCDHHGSLDISWGGLCFGLAIHTIIDGIALAAAVGSDGSRTLLGGLGVFLAIVLHKPLDALSITSLMAARGWNHERQLVVNLVFALMCPLGAILFALGVSQLINPRLVLGIALAFSAGIFLCISLGDLLPEVHFHSHDRLRLSLMLLLGVAIAYGIEMLPGHSHQLNFEKAKPAAVDTDSKS